MKPDDLFNKTLQLTLEGFEQSIRRYMPEGVAREYYLWALSAKDASVRKAWLEVMGVPQLVQLTLLLLEGSVPADNKEGWEELIKATVPMNVYQLYEIISDNLAIGLGSKAADDTSYEQRREVMLAFNDAMVRRIKGAPESAAELLAPVRSTVEHISSFEQSLNPAKHRDVAESYRKEVRLAPGELENTLWPGLLANIESCRDLVRASEGMVMGPLMTQALIGRYRGVSSLVEDPGMAFSRRIHVGVETILVEATLDWYVGVLGERILKLKNFRQQVEDGTVSEALYYTALLLRLLNDLGPALVTQSEQERKDFFRELGALSRAPATQPLSELLRENAGRFGAKLTRLVKDMQHREFNVCLFGLMDAPCSRALPLLEQRLAHASLVYIQAYQRLNSLTELLSQRLDCATLGVMMQRFVGFHVKLYSRPYNEQAGEYAV
ncbi:hypothetical protein JRI60_27400 [Archangium violaceum]|uniref:hypothetical protein n=1 Tax=Archangium violaceum TaxID=83451 RepID=UPI00195073C7|nr:hypothetical protein [Archangium violaceum]QRN92936.1 hypothetical protein JRI60_27400 [Archangium violaceum]